MKRSKATKVIWGMVAVLFLVLVGVYGYVTYNYTGKFIVNTTISGMDVSNMTLEQVEDVFSQMTDDYSIELSFRDGAKETIKSSEIDFRFNSADGLRKALNEQNPLAWPVTMVEGQSFEVESDFSEEKLADVMFALPEFDKNAMVAPVDAYIKWNAENGFYIQREVVGSTIKKNVAKDIVKKAIRNTEREVDIEPAYKNPKKLQDDPNLVKQVDNLKSLLPVSVTYDLPGSKKVELKGDTMMKWLSKDSDGTYYKDDTTWEAGIESFVTELAEKVDTVYKERTFHTNMGTDVKLRGTGYYGWKIWQDKEREQLKADLASDQNVERKPIYAMEEAAGPKNNSGFGKSYIEIDLTRQHLWVYQDGKEVFDTDVVSGKNTPDRRTPDGSFMTYDKQRDKTLRGDIQPDGSYGYESFVNYWIRLTNTGVGLHDAPWRHGRFGGNIWVSSGSHGCVNLPPASAKTIYEIVPEKTPVAIYYS